MQQSVYGENSEAAAAAAASAVQSLENEISWRVAGSDIQKLNNAAGKDWVEIGESTMEILEIAQDVAEKSGGAFDVTIAPISRLWDFDSERRTVPDSDKIAELLPNVGYAFLRLDPARSRSIPAFSPPRAAMKRASRRTAKRTTTCSTPKPAIRPKPASFP